MSSFLLCTKRVFYAIKECVKGFCIKLLFALKHTHIYWLHENIYNCPSGYLGTTIAISPFYSMCVYSKDTFNLTIIIAFTLIYNLTFHHFANKTAVMNKSQSYRLSKQPCTVL